MANCIGKTKIHHTEWQMALWANRRSMAGELKNIKNK